MIFLQASLLAPAADWVKQSPGDDFWTLAIILILLTVGGFIGAFYFFMRKRIIEDTPTSGYTLRRTGLRRTFRDRQID